MLILPGLLIKHKQFGIGTVIEIRFEKIIVSFKEKNDFKVIPKFLFEKNLIEIIDDGDDYIRTNVYNDRNEEYVILSINQVFKLMQDKSFSSSCHVIHKRGIKDLYHFTEVRNIDSIKKNGLLSINKLEESSTLFIRNDLSNLNHALDTISLSITNFNIYLMNDYISQYKKEGENRIYSILKINPEVLYRLYNIDDNGMLFHSKKIYSCVNASSTTTKNKLSKDIEHMFTNEIIKSNNRVIRRYNKDDNEPTDIQAEILFFDYIPKEFIEFDDF